MKVRLLLVAGVDVYYVSRMLGHASIQETVDTYGRWLPANRPGVLDALDSEPPVTAASTGRSVTIRDQPATLLDADRALPDSL